ncbi:hypothetical protein PC116_g7660 [Phytophthora cactorum]|nr:hypothetical protein PC116_g7660 [Phytophthora cactorum]
MHSFFFPGDNQVSPTAAKAAATDVKPSGALPPLPPHLTTATAANGEASVPPATPTPANVVFQQATIRRSPSRDLLFGPTWQSLLDGAQINKSG